MNIKELQTPAILIRKEAMENNLLKYQRKCDENKKELWPMIKTHKSTEICKLQEKIGATGFLCGTLDECEALCADGAKNIMYAYPVAGKVSCMRAVELAKKCNFFVRLDGLDAAQMLNECAKEENIAVNYTIIIDSGLHRFGIAPETAANFAKNMKQFENLKFMGISSHGGHVYGEADPDKYYLYAEDEKNAMHKAYDVLTEAGFDVKMVTTGSTPTFMGTVEDEIIKIYHPGNYIFNDCIQISGNVATEDECALVVYATVISHPRADMFICDAGAKCLGLDQGAHGNSNIVGHGRVIGHPEIVVAGLSEEVGKLKVEGETNLKVGDKIMIIPNHSCSSANLTDYYVMVDENEEVSGYIHVDIRGNKNKR